MVKMISLLGAPIHLTPRYVKDWLTRTVGDGADLDAELLASYLDYGTTTYGQLQGRKFLTDFETFKQLDEGLYAARAIHARSTPFSRRDRGRLYRSSSLRRRAKTHLEYLQGLDDAALEDVGLKRADMDYELDVRSYMRRAQKLASSAKMPDGAYATGNAELGGNALKRYVSSLPSIGTLPATDEEIMILRYLCSALSELITEQEVPWVPGVLGLARVQRGALGLGFSGDRDGHFCDHGDAGSLNKNTRLFYDVAQEVVNEFNGAESVLVLGTDDPYRIRLAHPLALDSSNYYPPSTNNQTAICGACRAFVAANPVTYKTMAYDTWIDTDEPKVKRLDAFVASMVLEVTSSFFTNPLDEEDDWKTREPLQLTIAQNYALFDAEDYPKKEQKEQRSNLRRSNSFSSLMKSCELCKRDRVTAQHDNP